MGIRTNRTRTIASFTTAALVAVTAALTAAAPADAATRTVTVRMSDKAIKFTGGGASTANGVTTLHAGRYRFHVVSAAGDHSLQLLRFRHGYTADQAQKDFGDAFSDSNVPAVRRLDNGVVFLGGADVRPKHSADMVVTLKAGQLTAMDLSGNAVAQLTVAGKPSKPSKVPFGGTYTAYSFGWGVTNHLPASGMVKFANQADQPHFLVLQHVKSSTTAAQVRKFIKSGMQGNPSWALKGSADSGVVSPGLSQLMTYDLKPGKYLVACFWPDYFTGMPHVAMGMWKLVTLR